MLRAGNVCHSNGTLAVLDTRQLKLYCHFPYPELAAFKSLNSLSLEFCRPVLVIHPFHTCLYCPLLETDRYLL